MRNYILKTSQLSSLVCLVIVSFISFILYATFRTEYVGGADSYGYYSLALSMKEGHLALPTSLDPDIVPSIAPLGYIAHAGKIVPAYPPGFPFLLAMAAFLNLEFFVNPIIGALSVILLYLILGKFVSPRIAIFFCLIWAFSPIVVKSGTDIMSDLLAASFLLLSFYSLLLKRIPLAGLILGLSLAVRPLNLIVFPFLLFPIRKPMKQSICFTVSLILGSVPFALYNWYLYGAPWATGYGNFSDYLTLNIFWHHLNHYVSKTIVLLTPIVILALSALLKDFWTRIYLLLWFLSFLLFYSLWWPGAAAWWWTRFLLPAYPPLILLTAMGLDDILSAIKNKWPRSIKLFPPISIIVLIIILLHFFNFGARNNLFSRNKMVLYAKDCATVKKHVHPNALIGAIDFSGVLRLYSNLESFRWDHPNCMETIEYAMKNKIPLYLIRKSMNRNHPQIIKIRKKYKLKYVTKLAISKRSALFRIEKRQ